MNASVFTYRTVVLSPSALSGACVRGDQAHVNRLLDEGHNINKGTEMPPWTRKPSGETALMLSCKLGRLACAELLLRRSASVNQQQQHGATALHVACRNGRDACVALLLRHGAEVDGSAVSVGPAASPEWGPINDDVAGQTPLTCAIHGGHSRCVELCLEHGCNSEEPRLLDKRSPLQVALEDGSRGWSEACVVALIQGGCHIPDAVLLAEVPQPAESAEQQPAHQLRDHPDALALLRRANEPWSPAVHRLFPRPKRAYARFCVWAGGQLAATLRATDAGAFLDVWLATVMPMLLGAAVSSSEKPRRQPATTALTSTLGAINIS